MYLKEEREVQFQKKQLQKKKRRKTDKYEEKLQTTKKVAEETKIVFPWPNEAVYHYQCTISSSLSHPSGFHHVKHFDHLNT